MECDSSSVPVKMISISNLKLLVTWILTSASGLAASFSCGEIIENSAGGRGELVLNAASSLDEHIEPDPFAGVFRFDRIS